MSKSTDSMMLNQSSDLPKIRETVLRDELCGDGTNPEQFELFRYTSLEDMEEVYKRKNDPELKNIMTLVEQRNWAALLKDLLVNKEEAHFALMVAYRYGARTPDHQLSATQVATIFYFLSAAMEDPNYNLVLNCDHFDDYLDEPFHSDPALIIHKKTQSKDSRDLLNGSLFKAGKPQNRFRFGVLHVKSEGTECFELSSITVLERLLFESTTEHFTVNFGFPNRREYIDAIFKGQHPFALLSPYSKSKERIQFIHGAPLEGSSVFVARHDPVHEFDRCLLKSLYEDAFETDFKQVILSLQALIESRPVIKVPLIEEGYDKAHLAQGADLEDLITRLIDELLIQYLDGEKILPSIPIKQLDLFTGGLMQHLTETMEKILISDAGDKHHDNVLKPQNEMKDHAIDQAFALVMAELKIILFPSKANLNQL